MPGRGKRASGASHSTSNCTDYQARRLNIANKVRAKATHLVDNAQCTAILFSRALVAILENNQQADVPHDPCVLRPWVGRDAIELKPVG